MARTYEELKVLSVKQYLTVNEAADYFNIGINRIGRLLKEPDCNFGLRVGSKKMVNRMKLEEYLEHCNVV